MSGRVTMRVPVVVLAAMALPATGQTLSAAGKAEALNAMTQIVAADVTSEHMVAYCKAQAPAAAAAVHTAWLEWRIRHGVDDARSEVDQAMGYKKLPDGAAGRAAFAAQMAQEGPAEPVCRGLVRHWATAPSMDLRARHPAAYNDQGGVIDTYTYRGQATHTEPPWPARPTGTVYTVAQLAALYKQDQDQQRASKTRQDGRPASAALQGRIYVQGRVTEFTKKSHRLQYDDGKFTASLAVDANRLLTPYEGQTLVYSGVIDADSTSYNIDLRHGRLVADTSGLVPASGIQVTEVLRRKKVSAEQIRAAPGRGLADKDILGISFHSEQHYDGSNAGGGLRFDETVYLLLRDGSLYDRLPFAPADLDVKTSRELEPQNWHEWRRQGNGFEIRRRDDLGRLAADWRPMKGQLVPPWPANHRLKGGYETSSFNGSIFMGGVFSKTTLFFDGDGRYEGSSFVQGGSGSMAAVEGFSAVASTRRDGQGSTSVMGGGNAGVNVTQQRAQDDGAERRGSYRLDGYTLEVRYDSGRVSRMASFPRGDRMIWVAGQTYLRPSR